MVADARKIYPGEFPEGNPIQPGDEREAHMDQAGIPPLGGDGKGAIPLDIMSGHPIRKVAPVPAKGGPEGLMAILTHHLMPGIPRDAFGLPVEKEDPPLQVMGEDSFLEAIQDLY